MIANMLSGLLLTSFLTVIQGPCMIRASNAAYSKLVDTLFTNYTKEVRPSYNHLQSTNVGLSMWLTSIQDLEEINQVFVSSVIIVIEYYDEYLSWKKKLHQGIDYLIYPQEKMWLPDLVVENSVDKLAPLGYGKMNVLITNRGKVIWRPSEVLRTSCDVGVTYYPFDTQMCSIILTTWVSQTRDIRLLIDSDNSIQMGRYQESGTWQLVNISISDVSGSAVQNRIAFNFSIKRRNTYYIFNLIIPVISLGATASLVFALPADAGEKIGMSITVLLAYAVYLTIISESMPKTSLQISVMGVYLSLLMVATALAVVCSVLVLHIHHKDESLVLGIKWRHFIIKLRPLIGLRDLRAQTESDDDGSHCNTTETKVESLSKCKEVKQYFRTRNKVGHAHTQDLTTGKAADQSQDEKDVYTVGMAMKSPPNVSWKHVSQTVDRLMFIIFTSFITGCSIIFVCLLTSSSL